MRGGGEGFTRFFLDDAEAAQNLLDADQREEALARLRSKRISLPIHEPYSRDRQYVCRRCEDLEVCIVLQHCHKSFLQLSQV